MNTVASIALASATLIGAGHIASAQAPDTSHPAHIRNAFQFTVAAPFDQVAPLFGPLGEVCWAGGHWNPQFLHPQPAHDIEGAVFTIQHGEHTSVWVNTQFDLKAGRMQYVSFLPGILISVVDVQLSPQDASTRVQVTYTRTALAAAANEHVATLGNNDKASGPEWQSAIESCLKAAPAPAR
jgi:hypothetical protein